jgi:hypothetical protein
MPDYPEDLWFIVRRTLARDRDDRYPTAAELARELDDFVASQGSAEDMPGLTAEILDALFPGEREERAQWLRRARGYLREPGRATLPPPVPVAGTNTPSMLPPNPPSSRPGGRKT